MANNSILDINKILNEYSVEVQEKIAEKAQKVAKEASVELKNTSPKDTGNYAKGWRVKTFKKKGEIECIVHNATHWQLTHLLEKPHAIRNQYGTWGTSKPKTHIAPVDAKYTKQFQNEVESVIKNGT